MDSVLGDPALGDAQLRDPLVGHVLDGRYRVESRLARGGMASVYLALDTRLDRIVALKVMHAGLAADRDFVARFIREAKSAARLSHPHVVAVHDQGTDHAAGTVWIAMEYVEGVTLRDRMDEGGALAPLEALELLEPVLAALGAAHRAGIVHRDVKPENVLLADDGRIKVADFGLARAVSASTSATSTQGMLIGTVAYLSPEQVERGVADPRSDVYSAGILLFEMLTGTKPFRGESPIQVAYAHVHDDVPPPSGRVRGGLPPVLDALVLRATSRDPDRRPVDASAFQAELVAARRVLRAPRTDTGPRSRAQPTTAWTEVVPYGRSGPEPTRVVGPAPVAGPALTEIVPVGQRVPPGGAGHAGHLGPAAHARPRQHRGWLGLLLVLVLALAIGVAGWQLGSGSLSGTRAPSLLDLTRTAALEKAHQQGLHVRFDQDFSESVPAGSVMAMRPQPASRVDRGATLAAVLSRGPERFDVPAVRGRSRTDAIAALRAAHLTLGEVTAGFDEEAPSGSVLSTDPAPGDQVRRDTAVNLVLSQGPAPITVPGYQGKDAKDATAALRKLTFTVTTSSQASSKVPEGAVITQSPATGTLHRGDGVRLVVSTGPPLVVVPDVTDKRSGEARDILESAGFEVRTRGSRILNRVWLQSPGSGHKARLGSRITLTTI